MKGSFVRCWKWRPDLDAAEQCGRFVNLALVQTIEIEQENRTIPGGDPVPPTWAARAVLDFGSDFVGASVKLVTGAPDEETLLNVLGQILSPASPLEKAIADAAARAEKPPVDPPHRN